MPQILVNDDAVVVQPAQRHRSLAQRVLARGAFAMRHDLLECTLAHRETGNTTQLLCADLVSPVSPPPADQRQLP